MQNKTGKGMGYETEKMDGEMDHVGGNGCVWACDGNGDNCHGGCR